MEDARFLNKKCVNTGSCELDHDIPEMSLLKCVAISHICRSEDVYLGGFIEILWPILPCSRQLAESRLYDSIVNRAGITYPQIVPIPIGGR